MKSYIYLMLSMCMGFLHAQKGFNKSYDLDNLGAGFSSIESSNDTIMAYGLIIDANVNMTGLLFSQIDSFGNIISSSAYFDKDGDNFSRPYQNSLIKLSDNSGYVAVGQLFNKANGYFIKYNNKAEVVLYREYPDTTFTFNHFKEIKEISSNSFLITGNEAYKDDDISNGFVIKVNIEGDVIWEKKYYEIGKITALGSIVRKGINSFLICGQRTDRGNVPTSQRKYSNLILEIDTLGSVLNTWSTNYSLNELGVGDIELSKKGELIYNTLRGQYNEEFNQLYTQPLLIRRDTNFNLLSSDTFGELSPYPHNISHIQLLNNNIMLIAGTIPQKYPIEPITDEINSLSGWINKFDGSGDIVWTFIDTAFWSSISGSNNVLYDVIELSSGSIIACGYNRTNEPTPKDWGWLLKVSKDGCIDTLDCEVVNLETPHKLGISVYPNPARDFIIFNINDSELEFHSLIIYDSQGKIISNYQNIDLRKPFHWWCQGFPRGMYYYKLLTVTGSRGCGQIILE